MNALCIFIPFQIPLFNFQIDEKAVGPWVCVGYRAVILTPGPGEPQGVLVWVFALLSAPIQIQETRWVELIDQLKQLITQLRAKQQQKPAHPAALQDQEWGSLV